MCEQAGRLRVVKNGVLLAAPFLTVTVDSSGERGLLGVAFDPDFQTNHYVYVYYTARTPSRHNRVSRFTANGDVVVAGSELVLLNLNNLSSATNHNGGALHFGPDGLLYIAVGDNANGTNAQSRSNLFGKILRIGKDGAIPPTNPFYTTTSGSNRAIWALGLRNPYTFAFNPASTVMFINDVGQSSWEEIDDGVAGANYGWPQTEGPTSDPRYRSPRYAYRHSSGSLTGCAITGGAFYTPSVNAFPAEYNGRYFFADYCNGWIAWLDPAGDNVQVFATGGDVSWSDGGGATHVISTPAAATTYTGTYRLRNPPCTIPSPPVNRTATVSGATLTLRWTAPPTGPQPASYRVEFGTASGQTQMSGTVPGSTTTASGILPGAGAFYFRVKSVNTCGTSSASHEAMVQR